MKILVIGGGGREHALAHTFHRQGHQVMCLPGNAGTAQICLPIPERWKGLNSKDFTALAAFAEEGAIDLTVVGPEAPLSEGIVDFFINKGLAIFGPTRIAAQLESSKVWSKTFMTKHAIPTARFISCADSDEGHRIVDQFWDSWNGIVVKPSGLTAGKGVQVCRCKQEAHDAVKAIMDHKLYGEAGGEVILEECLRGKELSIVTLCDGCTLVPLLPSQDHKRLLDGDKGPNTGGVGAYSPTPWADELVMRDVYDAVMLPTVTALHREGINYRGIIYFGIMLTASGPKVLEYNCRFGDPETQAVLPLLESDLAELMLSCSEGQLPREPLQWKDASSACVVMCSSGYPGGYEKGIPITGIDTANEQDGVTVFHAGTTFDAGGNIITSGGRVLAATAVASSLSAAVANAYAAVEDIQFDGRYYRKDIAHQALAMRSVNAV